MLRSCNNANIVLTFSEAVDAESGNITIKKTSDDSTIETIDVTGAKVSGVVQQKLLLILIQI